MSQTFNLKNLLLVQQEKIEKKSNSKDKNQFQANQKIINKTQQFGVQKKCFSQANSRQNSPKKEVSYSQLRRQSLCTVQDGIQNPVFKQTRQSYRYTSNKNSKQNSPKQKIKQNQYYQTSQTQISQEDISISDIKILTQKDKKHKINFDQIQLTENSEKLPNQKEFHYTSIEQLEKIISPILKPNQKKQESPQQNEQQIENQNIQQNNQEIVNKEKENSLDTIKCEIHKQGLQLYCADCKQLICIHCKFEDQKHQQCRVLPVISQIDQIKNDYLEFKDFSKNSVLTIQSQLNFSQQNKANLEAQFMKVDWEVNKIFEQAFQILRNKQSQMMQEIKNYFNEKIDKNQQNIIEINNVQNLISQTLQFDKQLKKSQIQNQEIYQFQAFNLIRGKIKQLQQSLQESETLNNTQNQENFVQALPMIDYQKFMNQFISFRSKDIPPKFTYRISPQKTNIQGKENQVVAQGGGGSSQKKSYVQLFSSRKNSIEKKVSLNPVTNSKIIDSCQFNAFSLNNGSLSPILKDCRQNLKKIF